MEDDHEAYRPCPPWCARNHDRLKWAHGGVTGRWDDDVHDMYVEVEPVWLADEEYVNVLVVNDYHHARLDLTVAAAEEVHRMLGEAIATLKSVTRASVGHPEG